MTLLKRNFKIEQEMDIRFDSGPDEVGRSLTKTLEVIKTSGETPELKMEMLFKYAIMRFYEGDLQRSYEVFGQTSSHIIDNGLPENIELFYWVARIFEEQNQLDRSLLAYKMALERITDDENFSNEILDRILNIEKSIQR